MLALNDSKFSLTVWRRTWLVLLVDRFTKVSIAMSLFGSS